MDNSGRNKRMKRFSPVFSTFIPSLIILVFISVQRPVAQTPPPFPTFTSCLNGGVLFWGPIVTGTAVQTRCIDPKSFQPVPAPGPIQGIQVVTLGTLPPTCNTGTTVYVKDASTSTGGFPYYLCNPDNIWQQTGVQGDGMGVITVVCASPSVCLAGVNIPALKDLLAQ